MKKQAAPGIFDINILSKGQEARVIILESKKEQVVISVVRDREKLVLDSLGWPCQGFFLKKNEDIVRLSAGNIILEFELQARVEVERPGGR